MISITTLREKGRGHKRLRTNKLKVIKESGLNLKSGRDRLTEDPIITQLRVSDEEILAQMDKTGTNFGEYNSLVIKRHKLYLKYEKTATNETTRYLISTIRQNILTQIKVTVLEEELVKLTIRVEKLETKT